MKTTYSSTVGATVATLEPRDLEEYPEVLFQILCDEGAVVNNPLLGELVVVKFPGEKEPRQLNLVEFKDKVASLASQTKTS